MGWSWCRRRVAADRSWRRGGEVPSALFHVKRDRRVTRVEGPKKDLRGALLWPDSSGPSIGHGAGVARLGRCFGGCSDGRGFGVFDAVDCWLDWWIDRGSRSVSRMRLWVELSCRSPGASTARVGVPERPKRVVAAEIIPHGRCHAAPATSRSASCLLAIHRSLFRSRPPPHPTRRPSLSGGG